LCAGWFRFEGAFVYLKGECSYKADVDGDTVPGRERDVIDQYELVRGDVERLAFNGGRSVMGNAFGIPQDVAVVRQSSAPSLPTLGYIPELRHEQGRAQEHLRRDRRQRK
jgi:hypothetical protein